MRRDHDRMLDMLEHCRKVISITSGLSRDAFDRDEILRLALTHLVQIIGEAAARVSAATRDRHPAVDWRRITAMRNRLVHDYSGTNYHIIWTTVITDVPILERALSDALGASP